MNILQMQGIQCVYCVRVWEAVNLGIRKNDTILAASGSGSSVSAHIQLRIEQLEIEL